MIADRRFPLISATGSTAMGQRVGSVVGARLGRSILELGGNNAIIVTPNARLDLTLPAIVFGSVGIKKNIIIIIIIILIIIVVGIYY